MRKAMTVPKKIYTYTLLKLYDNLLTLSGRLKVKP